jgi:hypothetical protein
MTDFENLPAPRFRMVVEVSFSEADPLDPSNYEELFTRWKAAVESNRCFKVKTSTSGKF